MKTNNQKALEISQAFKSGHITEKEMNQLINSLQVDALLSK